MQLEEIKLRCLCCCCKGSLNESEYVNLVETEKLANWEYPSSGNVLTGVFGLAVAVLCDGCVEAGRKPLFALQFSGYSDDGVYYHELDELEDAI